MDVEPKTDHYNEADAFLTCAMEKTSITNTQKPGIRRGHSTDSMAFQHLKSSLKKIKSFDVLSSSRKSAEGEPSEEAPGAGSYGEPSVSRIHHNPQTNIHFIEGAPTTLQFDKEDPPAAIKRPMSGLTTAFSHLRMGSRDDDKSHEPRTKSPLSNISLPNILSPNRPTTPPSTSTPPPPTLSFPPLKPRGPHQTSTLLGDVPVKTVNGTLFSYDQIRRVRKLYAEEKTAWRISEHINAEYGLMVSSNTIFELLQSEGLSTDDHSQERSMVEREGPEVYEEEITKEFLEDKCFKTAIYGGMVVNEDVARRLIKLWDDGKKNVVTLRLFIMAEYSIDLPDEAVKGILSDAGRPVQTGDFR